MMLVQGSGSADADKCTHWTRDWEREPRGLDEEGQTRDDSENASVGVRVAEASGGWRLE